MPDHLGYFAVADACVAGGGQLRIGDVPTTGENLLGQLQLRTALGVFAVALSGGDDLPRV